MEDPDSKPVSVTGVVMETDQKSLVIEATDHRILTFKLTKSTRTPPAALKAGDYVRIDAAQDLEAYLTALEIVLDRPPAAPTEAKVPDNAAPAEPPVAKRPGNTALKAAKPDPEDEGPPRLRHGQPNPPAAATLPETSAAPAEAGSLSSAPSSEPEAIAPPAVPSASQLLLERAREWALNFTTSLPNYVCQQFTTRYVKNPGTRDWQAKDVVSANVVYENGKEDYRNIAINGKPQSKKMEELPGSWSTGEFGTTLRSLFHPNRRAKFRYVKQAQITGMTASVYDYSVKRENSDWRVQLGSQAIIPGYSGRVWIDQKTARVIRIEMQADDIPQEFPLDKVESANDYGLIRLASTDQFMLPLHAETLSCERNSTYCSRNAIEFRNYHKYSGESNITF